MVWNSLKIRRPYQLNLKSSHLQKDYLKVIEIVPLAVNKEIKNQKKRNVLLTFSLCGSKLVFISWQECLIPMNVEKQHNKFIPSVVISIFEIYISLYTAAPYPVICTCCLLLAWFFTRKFIIWQNKNAVNSVAWDIRKLYIHRTSWGASIKDVRFFRFLFYYNTNLVPICSIR